MVWEVLTSPRFLIGFGIAIFAVLFWTAGFVVANYLWNRWRSDDGGADE